MEAVDRERIAIGAKLGLEIVPDPVLASVRIHGGGDL